MRENLGWSSSVGCWFGMPVRVHCFLVLFFALILAIEWSLFGTNQQVGVGTGLVTIAIICACVVAHELAHWYAIVNLGGHVTHLMLMPWGGNSDYYLTIPARTRWIAHAAGPFANGVLFAIGATLLLETGSADWLQLTNPFRPHNFDLAEWELSVLKISTWVNFQLLFVNLIPCFPFDGAAIVRSVMGAFNENLPNVRLESGLMVMGHAVAFTMIGLSLLIHDYDLGPIGPAWILMALGGISLFYAARYSFAVETEFDDREWDEDLEAEHDAFYESVAQESFDSDDGYAFDEFNDSNEFSGTEPLDYSQWLHEKQEERQAEKHELEQEENQLADRILTKLHRDGIESLSREERELLNRVSARLRRKRGQGV